MRADLDRWKAAGEVSFVGGDGPRSFPATRRKALQQRLHRDLALHPRERGAEAEVDAAEVGDVIAGVGARHVEDVRM